MSGLKNLVVVKFIFPGTEPAEKDYDIVPKSWIFKQDKIFKCFYPPKPYSVVESMTRTLQEPDKSWKIWTVKCLFNTDNYEIADEICQDLKDKSDISLSSYDADELGPTGDNLETAIQREQLLNMQKQVDAQLEAAKLKKLQAVPNKNEKKKQGKTIASNNEKKSEIQGKQNECVDSGSGIGGKPTKRKRSDENSNGKTKQTKTRITPTILSGETSSEQSTEIIDILVPTVQRTDEIYSTASKPDEDFTMLNDEDDLVVVPRKNNYMNNLNERVTSLEKESLKIARDVKSIKTDIKIIKENTKQIKNNLQKLTEIVENNKPTSELDCQSLKERYKINFPIASREDFDKFEITLKAKSQCRKDTKNVMANILPEGTDSLKGVRAVAKQFLVYSVTKDFVTQRKSSKKCEKDILIQTHTTFVNCFIDALKKKYKYKDPMKDPLSDIGQVICRGKEWGETNKQKDNNANDDVGAESSDEDDNEDEEA